VRHLPEEEIANTSGYSSCSDERWRDIERERKGGKRTGTRIFAHRNKYEYKMIEREREIKKKRTQQNPRSSTTVACAGHVREVSYDGRPDGVPQVADQECRTSLE
jgi:hypothetical protein